MKTFFLLPVVPPGEGILISIKFLDNSVVQLCKLRVKPTRATTHAMMIGLIGNGLQPEGASLIGARVVLATLAAFLTILQPIVPLTSRRCSKTSSARWTHRRS